MRARYPMFLSKNPNFLGLEIIDLFLIGVGLIISFTFRFSSFFGLATTVIMIVGRIIAAKFLDIKGLLCAVTSRRNVSVYWKELIDKEKND